MRDEQQHSVGTRLLLAAAVAALLLLAFGAAARPAEAKKPPQQASDVQIFADVSYVLAASGTDVDKAVISFTCTDGGDDDHQNQRGKGHTEHGNGKGLGHGEGGCPETIDVLAELFDTGGNGCAGIGSLTPISSAFVAGIPLPGTATFDFVPDVPAADVDCIAVTASW